MLGGVCCGIAERFDLDVALVRLLAVVLAVISAGTFAFVYLAIWLILPAKPVASHTVDVSPADFKSEVYEQVINGAQVQTSAVPAAIPPVPPAAASAYYQSSAHAGYGTASYGAASYGAPNYAAPGQAAASYALPARSTTNAPASSQTKAPYSFTTGLAIGILIIGVGLIALTSVLGILTVDVNAWVRHAGPFLLIGLGLFIMGRASKSNILIVCAAFILMVFIVVGAFFSLHEGPVELGASLPFTPDSVWEWRQG